MAKRTDANQKEIVSAFRRMGATVSVTSAVGHGFPDIVLGYRGRTYLVEIKDSKKAPSARKLTKNQRLFHESWNGGIHIIYSVDEAIAFIASLSAQHEIASDT